MTLYMAVNLHGVVSRLKLLNDFTYFRRDAR